MLQYYLRMEPQLFHAAVDQQLQRLKEEQTAKEEAEAARRSQEEEEQKDGGAGGSGTPPRSKSDLVLYQRMEEVSEKGVRCEVCVRGNMGVCVRGGGGGGGALEAHAMRKLGRQAGRSRHRVADAHQAAGREGGGWGDKFLLCQHKTIRQLVLRSSACWCSVWAGDWLGGWVGGTA